MARQQSPTSLALDPNDGLLRRICDISTSHEEARFCQAVLEKVLAHLRGEGAYILEQKDSDEEHKRLVNFLEFVHHELPELNVIYNLDAFVGELKDHMPLEELIKLLPASQKPKKGFSHR